MQLFDYQRINQMLKILPPQLKKENASLRACIYFLP